MPEHSVKMAAAAVNSECGGTGHRAAAYLATIEDVFHVTRHIRDSVHCTWVLSGKGKQCHAVRQGEQEEIVKKNTYSMPMTF